MESEKRNGLPDCPVCVGSDAPPLSWWRLGVALVFAGQTMLFSLGYNNTPVADRPARGELGYWALHGGLLVSCLVVLVLLGPGLFKRAYNGLRAGKIELESLFALSLSGAFVGSVAATLSGTTGLYYEVVPIVLAIYTLGTTLAGRSRAKVREAAAALQQRFSIAVELMSDGSVQAVPVTLLRPGVSRVRIRPGEAIAVDGVVEAGSGAVRESAFTGEPGPVLKRAGDRVAAGTYAIDAELTVLVDRPYGKRRLDALTGALGSALETPARAQHLSDRVAQWFVPIVATTAAATFAGWYFLGDLVWWGALLHAMAVLLVACPCALGLATPIAVASGLERLALMGIKPRAATLLDGLAEARVIIFDKTGTLTEDRLAVSALQFAKGLPAEACAWLTQAVALAESGYAHPVAETLSEMSHGEGTVVTLLGKRWHAGEGVEATLRVPEALCAVLPQSDGVATLRVGTRSFACGDAEAVDIADKPVYCSMNGRLLLVVLLKERVREGVDAMLRTLHELGLEIQVLSGDPHLKKDFLATSGVRMTLRGDMTPEAKAAAIGIEKNKGSRPLFVGDGINDAPALHTADCGIAVDSGTELAQSLGHGVIGNGQLVQLPQAIRLARRAQCTLRENLVFALCYNAVGIALAAAGLLHPAVAAVIMAVSSIFVSLRAVWAMGKINN